MRSSTVGKLVRWELAESEVYALCVSNIGSAQYVDRALAAILDAISKNPAGFPSTGVNDIRIAKTEIVFLGVEVVPALNLRFRLSGAHTVDLLHLEICPPEEMFDETEE